ncbi:hypothetical protein Clacol_001397 [Clathrus columnatus]|uniref:Uncharacterized protein n=1 Tax=Clathrus columnatus TaxID=1419009 RepID=A0AAV5A1A4_9AGAM|nr:hypothetical protein Clacol_001397 [Clathrus columnatus]
MFSRPNLKKEKEKRTWSAAPLHISIPLSQSPPLPPHRDFTSPGNPTDRKITPQLRNNVQLERASTTKPCTTVPDKFQDPSTKPSRGPLPSARSWHNLRDKKVQNTPPLNVHLRTQKISKPRPKKFTADEAEALQMYLQNTQSTPVVNDRPVNASSRNLTRDIHTNKDSPIIDSLPNLSSDDDDSESIRSATSEVTLDDYPWYFVEAVDDEKYLYGLSPISSYHIGDLEGKYILNYELS